MDNADRAQDMEEQWRVASLQRARNRLAVPSAEAEYAPGLFSGRMMVLCPSCGEAAVRAADGLAECHCRD